MNARDLSTALANHRAAVAHIRAMYPDTDETDLADTIEGASDLDQAILATLREALYREAQAEAVQHMIDVLQERQGRFRNTAQAMRAAALQAMQEAGIDDKPLRASDMSVSVGIAKPKVIITDEQKVLGTAYVAIKKTPALTAIREALERGQGVPGATLGNAQAYLRISRK